VTLLFFLLLLLLSLLLLSFFFLFLSLLFSLLLFPFFLFSLLPLPSLSPLLPPPPSLLYLQIILKRTHLKSKSISQKQQYYPVALEYQGQQNYSPTSMKQGWLKAVTQSLRSPFPDKTLIKPQEIPPLRRPGPAWILYFFNTKKMEPF
jgi:hypothetical protein